MFVIQNHVELSENEQSASKNLFDTPFLQKTMRADTVRVYCLHNSHLEITDIVWTLEV